MADVIFIVVTIAFFAIACWYMHGCDRLSEVFMELEYLIGLTVSVIILVYLVYALLWPEKF